MLPPVDQRPLVCSVERLILCFEKFRTLRAECPSAEEFHNVCKNFGLVVTGPSSHENDDFFKKFETTPVSSNLNNSKSDAQMSSSSSSSSMQLSQEAKAGLDLYRFLRSHPNKEPSVFANISSPNYRP